ncbi:MAG: thioredoxin family protein [Pseudomonadota bacterium]|nr:thioredoxin family protein [Pseudomonadota bacterium]
MKVQLLVSDWCASCHQAEKVWREVSEERDFDFAVVDMGQPEGRELVSRLRLKTIPALVVDDRLAAIGVQTRQEALSIVGAAPAKLAAPTHHVGLSMGTTGRAAVHSSLVYLFVAGGFLAVKGSLFLGGFARVAPLHLFTLGFMTFMVYALGEHMLPRFTGNPVRGGVFAWLQLGLAHAGLLMLVSGFFSGSRWLALAGACLAWLAFLMFALRMWPVLWPRQAGAAGAEPPTGNTPGGD